MAVNWLEGQANVGIERVCPGRHIEQSEWQPEWNNVFLGPSHYDYISDYECVFPVNMNDLDFPAEQLANLQEQKQQGTAIPIIDIAHFTTAGVANDIIATGGFTGGLKKINEHEDGNSVQERFSWWSPIFEENAKYMVRDRLEQVIDPFLDDGNDDMQVLKDQFATSKAFHLNPWQHGTYRNVYFKYSIEDMCQFYENYIGKEIQFKVLGTFLYKQEIMHAVLVCSQTDGAGLFAAYPPVATPDEEGAVVTRDADGNWVWKPQATATEIVRLNSFGQFPTFRRWEHVAFAFYLPEIDDHDHVEHIAVEDLEENRYEIVSEDEE